MFVSSTLREVADERVAARSAIDGLRMTPVMFELGARPYPPRDLYRAYLDQSDIFVGIYWESYGWVAPTETVSGLEDEYLLAGDRPKLIYLKTASAREPRLVDLLARIQADDEVAFKHFDTAAELADLLADDLAVLLTETFTSVAVRDADHLRTPRIPVPPTPIIDRETELADVETLLREPSVHLVTLVGSGGIGKTRLALEVARDMSASDSLEGVWFADLSPISDPARWIEPVAAELGVRAEGSARLVDLVAERLRGLDVLLVLDNFEQILTAAADLGELLAACPGLTVLVTSRSVLRLRGEREILLAALPLPEGDDAAAVDRSSAGRLFVARARQVRPGFAVGPENAAAVAELCRRLEGIPLALELAAAQLRLLSPAALLSRLGPHLDRSLDLLDGPVDLPRRQRTLRATLAWSHDLLDEAERALFARLSVFTGSWTLEAAEAVGPVDGDLDVLSTLSALVTHSLVTADDGHEGEPRFRMLVTVRSFARERLAERGETGTTMRRLAGHLQKFVDRAAGELTGPGNRAWSARMDDEQGDLRSVVLWAMDADDAETVVRLTANLVIYWWSRGQMHRIQPLAERAAALPSAARLPPDAATLLLWIRGTSLFSTDNVRAAEPVMREVVAATTAPGQRQMRGYGLLWLGLTRIPDAVADETPGSTLQEPADLLDEAAAIFRDLGDRWGLGFALSCRGGLDVLRGDPASAATIHAEGLAAAESADNDHLRAQLLDMLGLDAIAVGDIDEALRRYTTGAALHTRLVDRESGSYGIAGLGTIALVQGQFTVAARLMGAAAAVRGSIGVSIWPGLLPLADALRSSVSGALGKTAFAEASAEGAGLRFAEAFSYGLAATTGYHRSGPAGPRLIDRWDRSPAPGLIPWWTRAHPAGPSDLDHRLPTTTRPRGSDMVIDTSPTLALVAAGDDTADAAAAADDR